MARIPRVLSIAGTDPTGGAGIQADLKSIAAAGGYGMCVVTALVAQNTHGVRSIHVPPQDFLKEQLDAVFDDVEVDGVKIGMLGTPATISTVAQALGSRQWRDVVVDPVLICKGQEPGAALDTDNALRSEILPLATVVTPNLFEAATLAGMDELTSTDDLAEAVPRAAALDRRAVRAHAEEQLGHDRMVREYLEVFAELLDGLASVSTIRVG